MEGNKCSVSSFRPVCIYQEIKQLSTSTINSHCNYNCVDIHTIKPKKNKDGKNIEIILIFFKVVHTLLLYSFIFRTKFKGDGKTLYRES